MTSAKRHAHAEMTAQGDVAVYMPDTGELDHAWSPGALLAMAESEKLIVSTRDDVLLRRCLEQSVKAGLRPGVIIGNGSSLGPSVVGLSHKRATIVSGAMFLPNSAERHVAAELGINQPPPAGDDLEGAELLAAYHGDCAKHWRTLVLESAQVAPRLSLGATAAGIIPRKWRRAAAVLQKGEDWAWVRKAYFGGRVQCFQPGWSGEAVEYDLRGAYGWALSKPIPDWKLYERPLGPLPMQPAWFDATVEVSGRPGPLPVRADDGSLTWPESGRWRGTWTRLEIEQPGVHIVTVHEVVCGRENDDLVPAVERWLERREHSTRKAERALLRLLCCALAGKLCQKPVRWSLWTGQDEPPIGSMPLGFDSALMAVPSIPAHWPFTCPQAGSYVTAAVRCKVRPELMRSDIIYTDTDSAHLPADAAPPVDIGPAPGQWSAKERGPAHYRGNRQYTIGEKRVGNWSRH